MRKDLILILLPLFFIQTIKSQNYDEKLKLSNGYYRVTKAGKIGVLNDKEEEITKIIYDNCSDFSARGFANVTLADKIGIINLEGQEIVPLKFIRVFPCSKIDLFITLTSDSLYGVYNAKGKELFINKYNHISNFNKFGVAYYRKGKEYGILHGSGVSSVNTFDVIYKEKNGFFLYEQKIGKKLMYDFIDSTGKINFNYYDDAFEFDNDGWAIVSKNKKYGYINSKMELVVPYEYEYVRTFKNDTAVAIKNGIPGKITRQNKYTATEKIFIGKSYSADKVFGLAPIKIGDLWGFINKDFKLVIPFIYEDVNNFTSTGFAAAKKNGQWGVIDTKNKEVFEFTYDYIGFEQDSTCYVKEGMGNSILNFFTKKDVIKPGYALKSVEGFENGLYNVTLINGEKATMSQAGVFITASDIEKQKMQEVADKWKLAEKTRKVPSIKSTPNFLIPTTSITGLSIPKSKVGHKANYPYGTNDIVIGKSGLISIGGHQNKPWEDNDTLKKYWIGRHKKINDYYSNLDFYNYESGGPSMLKMAIENEAEDIIACYAYGFKQYKKVNNSYDFVNSKNIEYLILGLLDVKNNKVAAIAVDGEDNNNLYEKFYLLIWDYKKNELVTHLLSAYKTNTNSKIIRTKDGNVLVASSESSILTLEKIDINKTILNGKISSIWKKQYFEPQDNLLSDIIEDRSGNFVVALRSFPKTAYFTDEKKTKYEYAHVGIAKISADGNSFGMNVVKEIEPASWGRSKGGQLTMKFQDKILLSPFSYPKIIQNEFGDGYLLQTRYSYGQWKYSSEDGSNGTDDGRTVMYADQPCILLFDEKSLNFNSTDFIETTFSIKNGVSPNSYNYKDQLGKFRRAQDFLYVPEEGKYLLLDGGGYSTNYFYFSIELEKNWSGEANSVSSTGNNTSSNTNTNKNINTVVSDKKTIKNTGKGILHMGADGNTGYSINGGSSQDFPCGKKVYYTFYENGGYNGRGPVISEAKQDCGGTINANGDQYNKK